MDEQKLLIVAKPNGATVLALTVSSEVPDDAISPGDMGFVVPIIDFKAKHSHPVEG